jgi:hypothetical protein
MRDFGAQLRFIAVQSGWTQEGVPMDTSRQNYYYNDGNTALTNAPQGTHCVATPTKDTKDHRAQDFIRILSNAGVKCESGGRGYYPVVERSTIAIYIGVNSE